MKVICLENGPLQTNSYVCFLDDKTVFLIDPASKQVKQFVDTNDLKVRGIINTHGHFDHIAGNVFFDVPVYIHKDDMVMLGDSNLNFSSAFGEEIIFEGQIIPITKEGRLDVGKEIFVLYTPGHTRGSISLLIDDMLFSGDTLFAGSIGRTDLPGGDYEQMIMSLNKIMQLDDKIKVYPGHGEATTIGRERKTNPFYEAVD